MSETNSPFKKDRTEEDEDVRAAWAVGFSRAAEISNVGFQFVIPVLVGWQIDRKFGTEPICLCVGLALGMCLSLTLLFHLTKRLNMKK